VWDSTRGLGRATSACPKYSINWEGGAGGRFSASPVQLMLRCGS
jgi:hypothetical protein